MATDQTVDSLRREIERLRCAVEELSVLNDLAVEIASSKSSRAVIETIIRRTLQAVAAEQGVITVIDHGSGDAMHTLLRAGGASAARSRYHFSEGLLGWMQLHMEPLVVAAPESDERFRNVHWDETIRSLVSVPMMVKAELKAVLTVYNKIGHQEFTEVDKRLVAIIGAQSAQVLENARLREQERTLLRMREQLRLASEIQSQLLPKEPPEVPGYDVAGSSTAAQTVGGDYFDFIPIDEERVVLCLGDISGKGLPASLLMANLQATIRGQAMVDCSPAECLRRTNRFLFRNTQAAKFATFFFSLLDRSRNELTFCNAGHNPPLLFSGSGEPRRLQTGGAVLGVIENSPYEETAVSLRPGDVLVVYSDGVTEAIDRQDEELGEERLVAVLRKHLDRSARSQIEKVLEAVREHSEGVAQTDDITLVIVRRTDLP